MTRYEQIECMVQRMEADGISPDEQDEKRFAPYVDLAKVLYGVDDEAALQLVYEALLYMKLKNSESADPLQEGDKLGIGFS